MGRAADLKIRLLQAIIRHLPRRHFDVAFPAAGDQPADVQIYMSPFARLLIKAVCRAQHVTMEDYFRQAWGLEPASPWSQRIFTDSRLP